MRRKILSAMSAVAIMIAGCSKDDKDTDVAPTVYVAGEQNVPGSGLVVAKLWKNGVADDLSNGTTNATTTSVFVSGSDVYVTGNEATSTAINAKLWKNGVAESLSDGATYAKASGVFVK